MKKIINFIILALCMVSYGQTSQDYFKKGNESFNLRNHIEAIKYYKLAIEIDPNVSSVHYSLGKVYMELKNYEKSHLCFVRAMQLGKIDTEILVDNGISLFFTGDKNNARYDFDNAIFLDSNNSRAYFWRGILNSSINNNDKACKDLNKALDLGLEGHNSNYIKLVRDKIVELIEKNCG